MEDNNKLLIQILQTLNEFQIRVAKEFAEIRAEIKANKEEIQKSREIENEHWLENLRRWEENKKLWEKNEKRWEENERRWEENKKRWEENEKLWMENNQMWKQYEVDRKKDRQEIIDMFIRLEVSISEKLGDPNADKMKKAYGM